MGHSRKLALVLVAFATAVAGWAFMADGAGGVTPQAAAAAPVAPLPFRYQDSDTDRLLFRVDPRHPAAASAQVDRGDGVPVLINRHAALAAARRGTMEVALPDGGRYPVRYERSENAPGGNWTFVGRVDTAVGELATVITFGRDGVFGLLPTPDGGMMQITSRGGQAFLRPAGGIVPPGVDPSRHPDYIVPSAPARATGMGAQASAAAGGDVAGGALAMAPLTMGQSAAAGEVSIDVLATYTANLVALRGSASAAETEFQNLVAVANQAHIDSGSRVRLRIADFVEIDYAAAATNRDVLYAITDGNLPDDTDIRALRDAAAADLVAVIRPYAEGDTSCGVAWLPGPDLLAYSLDEANGYSVTAVEDCGPLVLAHETGHNLGLMHDRDTVKEQADGTLRYGAFPFSFGYRQDGPPAFATVMAYDVGEQVRINRFSHPGTTLCEGVACGIAEEADSVRSLNLTGDTVARFRDPPHTISIFDARVLESNDEVRGLSIYIRTTTTAPEGGITFDLVVAGGTSTAGTDWQPDPSRSIPAGIPAGYNTALFQVEVFPDTAVEGDETIIVRLENVQGMTVHDAEAIGTIQDDDPRVTVGGLLRFPDGITAPAIEDILVQGDTMGFGGLYDGYSTFDVEGTDYRYAALVPKGGHLEMYVELPDPFLVVAEPMVNVRESVLDADLAVQVGVRLSGTLLFTGCGGWCGSAQAILWNPRGNGYGYYVNDMLDWGLWAPEYSMLAMTDVAMQLEVRDPPAPYVRQLLEIPPLSRDTTMDVELRDVPSLTIAHVDVVEGTAEEAFSFMTMTAELSVAAPPGGVTFDITPGGTAGAGDYSLPARTFEIPEGQTTVPVTVIIRGDDEAEPDETLELQVTGIQGAAWSPGPGSVRILTDESHAVGGGNCTGGADPPAVRMCF